MWLIRFLLRFVIIPLGVVAGGMAAILMLVAVSGSKHMPLLAADPDAIVDAMIEAMAAGPAVFFALASISLATTLPALLAVAVAEIAAIRSWLYYAATGGLAAWIGWWSMADMRKDGALLNEPTLLVAAGIAGGLGYWLVAGWNAGFWKPVFASDQTQQPAGAPPAA